MANPMCTQRGRVSERRFTLSTFVWFRACVNVNMARIVASLPKRPATVRTFVWFFVEMNAHVLLDVELIFTAYAAFGYVSYLIVGQNDFMFFMFILRRANIKKLKI